MKDNNISLADYKKIYEAASRFQKAELWNHMYDSDLFGVRNPETGEIGYCCIMGNLGSFFALGVYRGTEGLLGHYHLQEHGDSMFSGDREGLDHPLESQYCLMASFEDRSSLQKEDLSIIKDLGLKFRGSNNWPSFRSHVPCHFPWFLTKEEIIFLTLALEQACDVGLRYKENSKLLTHPKNSELFLVRELNNGVWEDSWDCPSKEELEKKYIPSINQDQVDKLLWQKLPKEGTWILDCFLLPMPIDEKKPPRCPYLCPFMTPEGQAINAEIFNKDASEGLAEVFMNFCTKSQQLPEHVIVATERSYAYLAPLAEKFSFTLELREHLPMLIDFFHGLQMKMMGSPV